MWCVASSGTKCSCFAARLVRRYVLSYIPPGFWPRLIARAMAFPKREISVVSTNMHMISG